MAAGEAGTMTAELPLPPPPPLLLPPSSPTPAGTATERALEEAAASGTLSLAGRRLRAFPVAAARRWDLSDTTQAGETTPPHPHSHAPSPNHAPPARPFPGVSPGR